MAHRRPRTRRMAAGRLALGVVIGITAVVALLGLARATPAAPRSALAADPTQRGNQAFAKSTLSYAYEDESYTIDLYAPTAPGRWPVVILLPSGSSGGPENHVGHGEHLASWGYVVAVPRGLGFVAPSDAGDNAARAVAVLDAVLASEREHTTDRIAIVGTHFNGASAMRATLLDVRFKAIVGLHPDLMPFTASGSRSLRVPYLILGGSVEGGILCPFSQAWMELYFNSGSAHKSAYYFNEAHPGDFQEPPYEDLGDFCGRPRATPFPWIRGLMTAWLEYYLKGNTAFFDVLYRPGGLPRPAAETSDSEAINAPQGLTAAPLGNDGVQLRWSEVISDTTVLHSYRLFRSEAGSSYHSLADVPLTQTEYQDLGVSAGVSYGYTVAYLDRAGNVFQTAEPVTVQGGAPTFTPTASASPTRTPRPTATETPLRSPTATRTATASRTATRTRTPDPRWTSTSTATPTRPADLEAWAYLPFAGQSAVLGRP